MGVAPRKPRTGLGKKKTAVFHLIRAVPESEALFQTMIGLGDQHSISDPAKDRTAAIMGASFLEYGLKKAALHCLKSDPEDPELNYLFQDEEAPYREFAGRIRLARALGIIDRDEYRQLEVIRSVRNAFAHTMQDITFQTPEISDYLEELTILDSSNIGWHTLLDAFATKYSSPEMVPVPAAKANRMSFTQAVFLFYWKLYLYPTEPGAWLQSLLATPPKPHPHGT